MRSPEALDAALRSARERALRLGCAFVRFEPGQIDTATVACTGARNVRSRQYEHTLVLDLGADDAQLRHGLAGGHRSSINAASRRGLSTESSNDPNRMPEFLHLLRKTERRAGFYSYDDPYFAATADELVPSGRTTLYFAMFEGSAVAAAMVFDFADTRYYAYGAAESDVRRRSAAAPLVWQTILDARASAKRHYDFWGSAPPDSGRDHPRGASRISSARSAHSRGATQAPGNRPCARAPTVSLRWRRDCGPASARHPRVQAARTDLWSSRKVSVPRSSPNDSTDCGGGTFVDGPSPARSVRTS